MSKKKRTKTPLEAPSSPGWMTTYGDMVTLLLTFFVLLLSFSTIDEEKFKTAMTSLQGALSILEGSASILDGKVDVDRRIDVYNEMKELEEIAAQLGYEGDISVEVTEGGVLIHIGDRVLFDLGKADLKSSANPVLNLVSDKIKVNAKEVFVSGHTDDIPIVSGAFASNWELSSARALSVVKYLIEENDVPPEILAATGYSEYHPLVPNTSSENRRKNRRVELLVTWK